MQKAPQKTLLRSSNSIQSWGGFIVGTMGFSSPLGSSSRWNPIISHSLTHLAEDMAALVKCIERASFVPTRAHAWA